MKIEVVQKGITSGVGPVPTDIALIMIPVILEPFRQGVADKDKKMVRVSSADEIDSVDDSTPQSIPSIYLETQAIEEQTKFIVDFSCRRKDFGAVNVKKRSPGPRNEIAHLKNTIDQLSRRKDRWMLSIVKSAWNEAGQRKQILTALSKLRQTGSYDQTLHEFATRGWLNRATSNEAYTLRLLRIMQNTSRSHWHASPVFASRKTLTGTPSNQSVKDEAIGRINQALQNSGIGWMSVDNIGYEPAGCPHNSGYLFTLA